MLNGNYATYSSNNVHGEDRFVTRALNEDSVLDAVADGLSMRNGKVASELTIGKLANGRVESLDDVLRLLEGAHQESLAHDSATTVAVTLKVGAQLFVANAGDSDAYLVRGSSLTKLTRQTTTVVGHRSGLKVHTAKLSLQAGDRILLATDGIVNNIDPRDIAGIVRSESTPEGAVAAISRLLAKKHADGVLPVGFFGLPVYKDDATAIIRYLPT